MWGSRKVFRPDLPPVRKTLTGGKGGWTLGSRQLHLSAPGKGRFSLASRVKVGKQAEALTPLGQKRLQGLHPCLRHTCVFTAPFASLPALPERSGPDSGIPREQEGRESSSRKDHHQNHGFHT